MATKDSVKDKLNLLSHNQWSCGEYLNNTTGFTPTMGGRLSVTDEYNTIGNKSLKSTTAGSTTSIDMIHVVNEEQIGHTGVVSFDTYSISNFNVHLMSRIGSSSGSASVKTAIAVPADKNTHVTLTIPEILSDTYSIFVRLQSNSNNDLFVDNFVLNLN